MYADFNLNIQSCKHLNRSIAALNKRCMCSWHTWMMWHAPVIIHRLEIMEGKKALHFCGKHNSLPTVSVPYPHPETTSRTRRQRGQINWWKDMEYNNHTKVFCIRQKFIKTAANNTPALSESIICAVQWGMWIMAVKKWPQFLANNKNNGNCM